MLIAASSRDLQRLGRIDPETRTKSELYLALHKCLSLVLRIVRRCATEWRQSLISFSNPLLCVRACSW